MKSQMRCISSASIGRSSLLQAAKPIFTAAEIAVKYSNEVIYLLGNLKYAYIDLNPIFDFFEGLGV